MNMPLPTAPWRAVLNIQRRRSSFPINSLPSRIADHAVGLALSPKRAPSPYFAVNALRDARTIVLRRDRLEQRRFPQPLYGTPANPDSLEIRHETSTQIDPVENPAEAAEEERQWINLYQAIRARLAERHPKLPSVFDGWRDGETVQQTAVRLDISQGYVKKLRLVAAQIARDVRGR